MGAIVDIQFKRLEARLRARDIQLTLGEDARNWLAEKGYDPQYGARPLKRVMQTELQNKLAEALLAGDISDGSVVAISHIDVPAGLSFDIRTPPMAASA